MPNNTLPSDSLKTIANIQRKVAKTSSERSRSYRERQRAHKLPKRPPKTAAERVREWRARLKLRTALENANHLTYDPLAIPTDPLSPSTSSPAVKRPTISILKRVRIVSDSTLLPYKNFLPNKNAHAEFQRQFLGNPFGYICAICDRLCFKNDIKLVEPNYCEILQPEFSDIDANSIEACVICRRSLKRHTFPKLSKTNGFSYPKIPDNLPKLDLVSERLITPYIPFAQIRRLRHTCDSFDNCAQIINFPTGEQTLVKILPRYMDGDHCININIHERKILETRDLISTVEKQNMRIWLNYLVETPLYRMHKIKINKSFFEDEHQKEIIRDEISEEIPEEESLIAQQQTLLWNDLNYFQTPPRDLNIFHHSLFVGHIEELSFPSIYLGISRVFSKRRNSVTPLMIMMSELRRSDRRGVTPQHLLYMAMKMMTLRVRGSLPITSRPIIKGGMNKERLNSEEFVNKFVDDNLTFLKSIPNSPWHWAERTQDLLAMIRQIGRPTISLTFQANEIGWNHLLQVLFKCRHDGCEILETAAEQLSPLEKSTLVNQDAVTCAIYFNALINVLISILQSKKCSPFKQYRVINYTKRMEFPHNGSPRVHVLLWLDEAPADPVGVNKLEAIEMIDKLISVSHEDAPRNIELQAHKHKSMCYTRADSHSQMCQYGAPFMPCQETMILVPMEKCHPGFSRYAERFRSIKQNLEMCEYTDMEGFYEQNQIISEEHYIDVLRAGISQSTVFLKRQPHEIWNLGFNPFILNIINSCIDMQFILDDHSCAKHIAHYIDKASKGMSDLRRRIVDIADENPAFDLADMTKRISGDVLRTMEMTTQEAAWYLLKEPMCNSSTKIVYIPTVRRHERQNGNKNIDETEDVFFDDEASEVAKNDYFHTYVERPQQLENVTLAQFVSNYLCNLKNEYARRIEPYIIRYRNYDREKEVDEYKREMVTLHLPFRCEEWEILLDNKFVELFDENEEIILQRRKEFETDLDVKMKIVDICKELCDEARAVHDFERREFIFESSLVKIEPMVE